MKPKRGTWIVWTHPKTGKTMFTPKHLYSRSHRGMGLQVVPDIAPFKNVIDGQIIGGRSQKRDMMRRYGVEEVGTEKQKVRERPPQRVDLGLVQEIKRAMGRL